MFLFCRASVLQVGSKVPRWLLPKTCTVAVCTAMRVVARSLVWFFSVFFCGSVRCVLWACVGVQQHALCDPVIIVDPLLQQHKS